MGNPSDHVETPLTGGYLLIVLAEPRTAEHKLAILKKLTKGLSCWNYEESGVEIVTELNAIVNQNIEGEEGKNGEQLFQYVSDNLVAEILINPQHSTLVQCVRNLLASFTKYRCIIHAGYSFTENGSWIVQDGSFSVIDFLDAYKTAEAQRTIRLHENHIRIDLHCSADADWNQVSRLKGTRFLLNPPEKIVDNESIESTVRWLCDKIEVVELDILLEGSQVVGNIRFSRPTLYVFPAGQGDSALFGINGFNMLIDGGAGRNSCFWGFARHLDRLDAVLLTRLNSSNLEGVASFLKRKTMSSLYPQIGHFFCNFKTRKQISSPNTDAKQDVLSISLIDTAQSIITDLKQLQLRPHLCYRNINLEPINLYHKVGHGKLDMYVLNPSKDSKEVKDFLTKWNEGDQKLFNPTKDLQFPLPNIISVCTLLVWQPANPNTTITRIFFPGSSPQNKIFESLERVRHLEFLKHPSCSIKSMSSSTSVTIKSQTTKKTVLEKMIPGETKAVKTMENLEVSTSASNAVIQTAIIPTVPKEGTPKPKFPVEAEKSKPNLKTVTKETVNSKTKIEHKYSSISAKVNSNKVIQKSTTIKKTLKLSSKSPPTDKSTPTTPIENQEKTPKPIKQVIKPKSTIKSPSSTPTKSKKEEANRKVLVSSRTNSGLKRTQITKKEIKPAKPINEIETEGISSKKDSNIIYKSSLISGDKDKSGEEEDILIVEKVAITPEKLLTPDGKKIIANELDGILTTAKDIVIKEKCVEKLSDSGATTAPTMPEDEKINDSKKEIEVNESDQKSEEFKKAKDALKTPDEVADLPFHEEADEHKTKVTEKVIETEIESQEIVQVENAEYVLVSLDSSPEALKRQVLDNVNLLDTELDEESEKEDEYVEKKESKLIEHLLESSKDLCEITDKIDELKKQNEHEINNHLIHENLQNYSHGNTETINVCAELINQEKQIEIQEKAKSRGSLSDETLQTMVNETITTATNVINRSGSTTEEQERVSEHIRATHESKVSTKPDSIDNEQVQSSLNDTNTSSSKITSRSGSISIDKKANTTEKTTDKQDSKASSNAGSVCEEPVKSPVNETVTSSSKVASRSGSITDDQAKTTEISEDKKDSKASSKEASVCDEPVKSPVNETITSSSKVASRSASITNEQEKTTGNVNDNQDSKASSRAGSVCDEHVKSPVHETFTSSSKVASRSGSIITEEQEKTTDKQDSKASSKAGSVCDEPVKSPVHETILTANKVPSRSGSITTDEQEKTLDKLESKTSSKSGSVCDEPVKSPVHETILTANKVSSRSGSITTDEQEKSLDKLESKASSKAGSVCDEPVKSPIHETNTSSSKVASRSASITNEQEKTTGNVNDNQNSKASSRAGSVCDEHVKSPVHETFTSSSKVASRSGSIITEEQEKTTDKQDSKASSKAGSVCDEPVKSPVHETILTANIVTSRSGSITNEQEKTTENVNENQGSKESSRAGSVCDEHVKSPVHETITSSSKVASRSASITTEEQEKTLDKLESKASSKAGSVCDEPVKSPVHETILTADKVASRSGSITTDEQEKTLDKLESKASSKAGSVCDEQVKSPVHETITSSSKVASRSGSITTDEQEITTDKIDSKASSKAGSVCDEPVKSPVHETILTADKVASRSGSITTDEQEKTLDKLESKASSKSSSVCDEPVKSPIRETITSSSKVASRSGSITNEQEKTTENVNDNQDSKVSSRAGSVCDKHVKSPVYETITSSSKVASRSGSITTDEQEITTDIMDSKASSKAGSVCDELVESLLCEATASDKIKTMISSSISHEPLHDNQYSKVSRKASSICEEPLKSSELEINTDVTKLKSRPSSINQDQDIVYNSLTDKQEFNASSNETSSINYREPIKIDCFEKNTNERVISSRPNSEEELLDSVPSINKYSTLENTISDISFKEQEIVSTSLINKSNSICQDTESTPTLAMDKYDIETSSRKDSFCQDKNESITISSSSTSSICQEINTQSSKLSSRKSSIIDDLIDKPSKLQIGEKSSSLQESNIYDHSIDDNSKIFNKSGSLCDEMLNMSFNKVTENVISNKTCERIVSPTLIAENTECKIDNKEGSVGEESMKSSNNETGNKGNLISSTLNSIPQKTEEEKNQSSKSSSIFDETQKLQIENNKIILSPFEIIETNVIEKKVEESKSLGRIGSLCEEIAKFLTDDDKKMSTNNTYESSCGINESTLKNNNEVLKVETEPLLQFEKNTYALNKIEKPLQLDDEVKVSEKHDNINEKNTDHSLPAENITVSNIKSSDISTILIEENNKTGIMNVAQMVGKNINDESFTKHTAITDNESKNLKTVNPISSITSEECISKLSNVLIEDIVKSSNEKNIMNNSSLTDICVNQPLGVTLNSEDLGVTKDIVMQLKRDVHEALHQCSSDDERPYTPQSESSMSRSAMNIDEDDDDNEDNKIETDDDMAGSPMSTGPSPIQMQLDNRQVEINIDFNKAIQEHRITRGEDLTTTEANGNHVTEIKTTEHDNINQNQSTSSDTVQSWGKPLGLPPVQSINNNGFDPIREWGKPFGLPSPTQPVLELGETQNMSSKITPKKLKKIMDNKPIINVMDKDSQNRIRRSESPSKLRSRSSSRMSRINPVYLDLIYVPHHGNSKYVSADFFKRVRARNYVFSGTDPSKEVLNALIEGKQAWEDQDLEVTIIPTYDTDTLGQWVAENEELLTKLKIDLSPSASRCTIKLQDHNTSCSAYRLEF
ncbi:microtubule-associated protein futsch-like isoform X10 [Aphis gossypii]|uniref:microtubule-associated protein futsch-like isoform X10 n=1 Tax=Aphis gossypii TaxID=80765 RepID=UPI002158BBC7|nr:microtubule-associated protein futsch-like isoform X10 [Aphis gossypii]